MMLVTLLADRYLEIIALALSAFVFGLTIGMDLRRHPR